MASDTEEETKERIMRLTEYANKLFGTSPGELHRGHFLVAATREDGTLISAACCPAGLAQVVLTIILTRPDQVQTEILPTNPAGEKGN